MVKVDNSLLSNTGPKSDKGTFSKKTRDDDEIERKYKVDDSRSKNLRKKPSHNVAINSIEDLSANFQGSSASDSGRKQKFVPLFGQDGKIQSAIKLPGRHICNCQASTHSLVNNCLNCGRIVCSQEGSGPCLFCESLVCTPEEQRILNSNTKQSKELQRKLLGNTADSSDIQSSLRDVSNDLQGAIEQKNRLLEFDRNCAKRTAVVDDECDYFAIDSNSWLTPEQKSAMKDRFESLRRLRFRNPKDPLKVTFDFAGRRILSTFNPVSNAYSSDEDFSSQSSFMEDSPNITVKSSQSSEDLPTYQPEFLNSEVEEVACGGSGAFFNNRLQNNELQEPDDSGKCLSMHQPYASLLVRGIKKGEGRSWYTAHRGRLWIAATARTPLREEIAEIEQLYRVLYNTENLPFPEHYQQSVILGCVEVTDCLSQEQYRERFPNGESLSPYVLICTNARELPLKMPISGRQKIYDLDPQIHQAAKVNLHRTY